MCAPHHSAGCVCWGLGFASSRLPRVFRRCTQMMRHCVVRMLSRTFRICCSGFPPLIWTCHVQSTPTSQWRMPLPKFSRLLEVGGEPSPLTCENNFCWCLLRIHHFFALWALYNVAMLQSIETAEVCVYCVQRDISRLISALVRFPWINFTT